MRVVLTTSGSYGDINPLIFVSKALKARGHTVTFATSRTLQSEITGALIVPLGNDQLQNAMCAVDVGCARAVSPERFASGVAVNEISFLLSDTRYRIATALASKFVQNEGGVEAACAAIEAGSVDRKGNEKAPTRAIKHPTARRTA